MDNISIKDNIRKIRKKHQLTQEDIAHKLGISLTAYRDLERGSTNIVNGHVMKLAELYETSTEEIVLGYSPTQVPGKKLEQMKEEYNERLTGLEKENAYLKKLVKSLEETIATKNQIIEMLQK